MTDALRKAAEALREIINNRTLPKKRPTIAELEAILAQPDGPPVTINPDGSIGQKDDLNERLGAVLAAIEAELAQSTPIDNRTDERANLRRLARERSVLHWPALLRLLDDYDQLLRDYGQIAADLVERSRQLEEAELARVPEEKK